MLSPAAMASPHTRCGQLADSWQTAGIAAAAVALADRGTLRGGLVKHPALLHYTALPASLSTTQDFGHFYGSSYFAAPDASRTPALARTKDGLIIADCDLNLCQQLKDKWGFRMTARYDMYVEQLQRYVRHNFKPQVVKDPSL